MEFDNGNEKSNIISIDTESIDIDENNDTSQNPNISINSINPNISINSLKESIVSIETIVSNIKTQVNNIETHISSENNKSVQYKQPKIKETSMFKDQNSNKKVKLNVGFNIHRNITQELTTFMKLKENVTSLNDATKYIMNYISSNKLQDITNINTRKYINPDEPLQQLFNIKTNDKITYFNIHKYINQHFIQ